MASLLRIGLPMRKPRKASIIDSGIFHKMWRGHNREHVLETVDEKATYLKFLQESYSSDIKSHIQLHAITIMGNHPHELGRITRRKGSSLTRGIHALSRWMRKAHGRYGLWYNRKHKRQGKVAYDRPITKEVEPGPGVIRTMLYMDLNPVRAGIVSHPSRYFHSTHRYYAYGVRGPLSEDIVPPDEYLALGKTADQRRKKYRSICDAYMREIGLINDAPDESGASLFSSLEVALSPISQEKLPP